MSIESCVLCQKRQEKRNFTKQQIMKEIKAFLECPNNYYINYNPENGFYKFEMIK